MTAIITFFESIINFIVTSVQSMVWVVTILPSYVMAISNTIAFLPTFIVPFIQVSMCLIVLFGLIRLL